MPKTNEKNSESTFTRKQLIDALNEDLSREYQAIIAYVNYSQVLKGAAYMNIAGELEVHAKEELDHALKVSNAIDYLGGMPSVTPKPVKTSEKAEDMLRLRSSTTSASPSPTIAAASSRPTRAQRKFAIAETIRADSPRRAGPTSPPSAPPPSASILPILAASPTNLSQPGLDIVIPVQ